jgi:hypothetical protein
MSLGNNTNGILLSTFPFMLPRHGGQIRMYKTLKYLEQKGHNLLNISFYEPGAYSRACIGKHDISLPHKDDWKFYKGFQSNLINDFVTGEHVYQNKSHYLNLIKEKISDNLGYIYVEHPWLFKFAEFVVSELNTNTKIILGYPNIEYQLKEKIFETYKIINKSILSEIKLAEFYAIKKSDLIFLVSKVEYEFCSQILFNDKNKLVYSRNGFEPLKPIDEKSLKKLTKILPQKFIFYIGSGHPPNFSNIKDFLGDCLGFLPPDVKLVVAGGVAQHVYHAFTSDENFLINQSRLLLLDEITDADLNTLRHLAHIIILPIGYGGGSALKTAEAIGSNSFVVSNDVGLRDFEVFVDSEKVFLCKNKESFTATIVNLLSKNKNFKEKYSSLYWDAQLDIVDKRIREIL